MRSGQTSGGNDRAAWENETDQEHLRSNQSESVTLFRQLRLLGEIVVRQSIANCLLKNEIALVNSYCQHTAQSRAGSRGTDICLVIDHNANRRYIPEDRNSSDQITEPTIRKVTSKRFCIHGDC